MNNHGLTKDQLLLTFPVALQQDASATALADITARLLARRLEEIERLRIYPAIDQLDEKLLDILAYDYKVDWWDANYTLEEKRRTLANSWRVHKILGTKAAVEMAISAIYPETTVEEWFEYEDGDGEPYHFRLSINITNDNVDSQRQRRVLARLNFYKNLRSHLDRVTYFMKPEPALAYAHGILAGTHAYGSAVITPQGVGPPRGIASPIAVAGVAGRYQLIAAGIDIPTAPPEAAGLVTAVGAMAGRHQQMDICMEAPMEQTVIQATAYARGSFCGTHRTASTEITLDAAGPAPVAVSGWARGAYCGTYRRLEVELPVSTAPPAQIAPFVGARSAYCGSYRRHDMEIDLPTAQAQTEVARRVHGMCCGMRREMQVDIPTGIQPAISVSATQAYGRVASMHRKMIKEETINGALD